MPSDRFSAPVHFASPSAFRAWLRRNHKTATHLVVRIANSHAADRGITYAEALDEALCFGWIDGVRRSLDEDSFTIRFSPRRPRSIWSRINIRHVERLIDASRMTKAGLAAYKLRDEARTGMYSFENRPKRLSRSYELKFRKNKKAWHYFQHEAPWYRRTTSFLVMSAKREETQERRLALLIECCARSERLPGLQRTSV